MNLEQNEGKGFDLEIDEGEEKPFTIPDEWGPSAEEIEEDLRKEEEQRRKAEKKVEHSIDEEDFDIEKEIDDLNNIEGPQTFTPNAKLDDEKKYKEILQQAVVKGEKIPRREEALESYIIKTFQTKPVYTWETYEDFFPCASIEHLQKIYKENSFAGKVFEIIMIEAAKTMKFNIQGKTRHLDIYSTKNIWIDFDKIRCRTKKKRQDNRIKEAVKIIARILDGQLKYGYKTAYSGKPVRNRKYLILDFEKGVLLHVQKDFVQSYPEDYSLSHAELIFLRQVQNGLHKNNEQTFKTTTLLQYGEVAWGSRNYNKIAHDKTFEFMKRLQDNKRMIFTKVKGEEKYFVKDIKKEKGKKKCKI